VPNAPCSVVQPPAQDHGSGTRTPPLPQLRPHTRNSATTLRRVSQQDILRLCLRLRAQDQATTHMPQAGRIAHGQGAARPGSRARGAGAHPLTGEPLIEDAVDMNQAERTRTLKSTVDL
jgi:hypothetical protein